jgi:hypothetical protein
MDLDEEISSVSTEMLLQDRKRMADFKVVLGKILLRSGRSSKRNLSIPAILMKAKCYFRSLKKKR